MEKKELVFLLKYLIKDKEELNRVTDTYKNEPVEEFLKNHDIITKGLTPYDSYVAPGTDSEKLDLIIKDYFAYEHELCVGAG